MTTTAIPENILSRINTVKDFQAAAAKREAERKAQEEAETEARKERMYATLKHATLKLFPEDIQPYVVFEEMPSEYDLNAGVCQKRIEIPGLVPIIVNTLAQASAIAAFTVPVSRLIIEWNSVMCEYLANEITWSHNEKFEELGPALVFAQKQQELLDGYKQQILDAEKRAAEFMAEREALTKQREVEYEAQENTITLKSQDEIERDWIIATIQCSPLGHAFYKAIALLLSELSELHQDGEY